MESTSAKAKNENGLILIACFNSIISNQVNAPLKQIFGSIHSTKLEHKVCIKATTNNKFIYWYLINVIG